MTYSELTSMLAQAGVENAAWDAASLIEHFCGIDPRMSEKAREYTAPALIDAAKKRAEHFPLQYILGEWCFYKQTYEVTPDCLIPRSDTEILVEEAIKSLPLGARFADLCTGSGCIAVSTLCERPDTTAVAVDKFPNTLSLAARNAARNRVSDRFEPLLCDLLAQDPFSEEVTFDAILSNPPYIATGELASLAPELTSEPVAALDGGEDGLVFYRMLLKLCRKHLTPTGFALFEIGYDQADALRALAKEAGCFCKITRDLGGNDRVARIWMS